MFGYNPETNKSDKVERLILDALTLPSNASTYFVSQQLENSPSKKALLQGRKKYTFDVEAFSKANLCKLTQGLPIHKQIDTSWNEKDNKLSQKTSNGSWRVEWQGYHLDVIYMTLNEGGCAVQYYWILADTEEVAKRFFATVSETISEWYSKTENEILVFEGGYWSKDQELFETIKNQNFDNLVLNGELKKEILNDITTFFIASEEYKKRNLSWQRSYLFTGPPGNGKSHTVKALCNQMQLPCLYVRSFQSSEYYRRNSEENMRYVFQQARQSAPCLLILEDLDSLVNDQNRSFFLNQLDGFGSSNHGIVILATTNYPDLLDPALKRAGRFDRQYDFGYPGLPERVAYAKLWNMDLSDAAIQRIAESTEGFSFVDLREAFIFSIKQSVSVTASETMEQMILSQINFLKEKVSSPAKKLAEVKSTSSEIN